MSGYPWAREFKLWRNPHARREVIGQILDYAKDLASWSYEDLQRQISLALVEAALYRDGVDRLLVQPRVLVRTEIVQRFVIEGAASVESMAEEDGVYEGVSGNSGWDIQTQFWRAVFSEDFAFADPDSELEEGFPKSVKVRGAGLNGAALR